MNVTTRVMSGDREKGNQQITRLAFCHRQGFKGINITLLSRRHLSHYTTS